MLDKLPPMLRHFVIIVGGAFLGVMAKAILTANGITGVHWAATVTLAVNTAIVTGVTSFMILNLTPLTKQYGAFSTPNDGPPLVNTGSGLSSRLAPVELAPAPVSASLLDGVPTA